MLRSGPSSWAQPHGPKSLSWDAPKHPCFSKSLHGTSLRGLPLRKISVLLSAWGPETGPLCPADREWGSTVLKHSLYSMFGSAFIIFGKASNIFVIFLKWNIGVLTVYFSENTEMHQVRVTALNELMVWKGVCLINVLSLLFSVNYDDSREGGWEQK